MGGRGGEGDWRGRGRRGRGAAGRGEGAGLESWFSVNELKREKKGKRVKVGRMGGRRAWSSASHAS